MAKNDRKDNRKENADKGRDSLFKTTIDIALFIPISLLISALISTIIEWLGMLFGWWDQSGILHSQLMVENELIFLNDRLDKSILEYFSGITVKEVFDYFVLELSNLLNDVGLWSYAVSSNNSTFGDYIGAFVNMLILVAIRALVFLFGLPTFVLFGWVGFILGLNERDKRKAGGGRESGVIFSMSKKYVKPSILVSGFLYLAWPNSIDPVYIVFPFSCLFALSIAYMSASYKKYV